mmetsp:Transcript_92117/g.265104  ORF Transcript_92117/g.265104 Transcript_92117/m.265104 type:complete len:311 (+) Transcript_92117:539-1471(+)
MGVASLSTPHLVFSRHHAGASALLASVELHLEAAPAMANERLCARGCGVASPKTCARDTTTAAPSCLSCRLGAHMSINSSDGAATSPRVSCCVPIHHSRTCPKKAPPRPPHEATPRGQGCAQAGTQSQALKPTRALSPAWVSTRSRENLTVTGCLSSAPEKVLEISWITGGVMARRLSESAGNSSSCRSISGGAWGFAARYQDLNVALLFQVIRVALAVNRSTVIARHPASPADSTHAEATLIRSVADAALMGTPTVLVRGVIGEKRTMGITMTNSNTSAKAQPKMHFSPYVRSSAKKDCRLTNIMCRTR